MTSLELALIRTMLAFIGGLFIWWGIDMFNAGRYYFFGVEMLLTIDIVAKIFDTYRRWPL